MGRFFFLMAAPQETKNETPLGGDSNPLDPLPPPKETEFYDILEVPVDASVGQIKKSYFLKARKCHPDKNPNNPEAEEEFKLISLAYEVLSDPEKRAAYHRHGKAGVEMGDFDPRAVFSLLFGGGRFESYIGELNFFNGMAESEDAEPGEAEQEAEKAQKERVEFLKAELITKLKPWMEGNAKLFADSILAEAEELRNESYGAELLHHLGYIYENEAKQHMRGFLGIPGMAAEVKEKVHLLKEVIGALSQASKTMMLEEQLQLTESEEERRILEPMMQKESIVSMWRVARLDIESAVREACEQVLRDDTIDKQSRKRRAAGLKLIGKVWKGIAPLEGKEGAWKFLEEMDTQYAAHVQEEDAAKWRSAWQPGKRRALEYRT